MTMTKPVSLLVFLLWALPAFAQNRLETNTDSLAHLLESDTVAKKTKIAASIGLSGSIWRTRPDDAIGYALQGLEMAAARKDSLAIAELYQVLGSAYIVKGVRDSSSWYHYHALALFERLHEDRKAASAYNNIARSYRRTEPEKAIGYYDKAMAIYERLNDLEGKAIILNESGMAYENKGELNEAIRRYKASLAIQEKRKDLEGIGYSLEFLSSAYLQQKNYKLSEDYIMKALEVRKATKDSFALSINYANIAMFYLETGKYRQVLEYCRRSNDIAFHIKFPDLAAENFKNIAEAYSRMGDYQNAFRNIKQHYNFKDSIFNIASQKQIQELNTRYEAEKHKLLIKEQQYAITKRNYWIGGIIALLIALVLIAYLLYRRYRLTQEQRLQAAILEQQEQAASAVIEAEEKERQRVARDLHDGIGQMMSTVKMNLSLCREDFAGGRKDSELRFEQLIHLVDDSCRELRNVSHNMMPNALMKHNLASAMRDFIYKLDKQALEVDLYTEGWDNRADANTETVLYRILQECVNNVLRHARATRLDISLIRDKDGISATVEDNGKGFIVEEATKAAGLGLQNIYTRVAYLKGTVDIHTAPGQGTLVALHIPLRHTT